MEMLNGFDLVVALDNKVRRERSPDGTRESANGNDVHNHVYRLILKNERDKAQHSIRDISEEIKTMQGKNSKLLNSIRLGAI